MFWSFSVVADMCNREEGFDFPGVPPIFKAFLQFAGSDLVRFMENLLSPRLCEQNQDHFQIRNAKVYSVLTLDLLFFTQVFITLPIPILAQIYIVDRTLELYCVIL